jgi:formylglycine-generating enzyme required for sulfatase activity
MYSAGVGESALDSLSASDTAPNSPYTRVLLPILRTPGLSMPEIAMRVRQGVIALASTVRHEQTPAYYDQLVGNFVLVRAVEPGSAPQSPPRPITAEEERALSPRDSFKECDDCPEMVVAPPGSFVMGSADNETGRRKIEGPAHKVTFARGFAAGRYAVTRDQLQAFVTATGYRYGESCRVEAGDHWVEKDQHSFLAPGFAQDGRHPAVCVSWHDAEAYVRWLSERTGKHYRLLTEAEREYIARAGSRTPYWWGATVDYRQANYDTRRDVVAADPGPSADCRSDGTTPVECFGPNPWGFFQVHGNVAEWTQDCWSPSYDAAPADGSPAVAGDCSRRVLRGGGWSYWPEDIRAAYRESAMADHRYFHVGLRVARDLGAGVR